MFPAQGSCHPRPRGAPGLLCDAGGVLSEMRNRSGGPNWAVRGLAVLLALLLAGPLSVYLLRGLVELVRVAF